MQPLLVPYEQARSHGRLQLLNAARHARLYAMQLSRRAHDAAFLYNRFEDRQVG
jgi:hypothetical protein